MQQVKHNQSAAAAVVAAGNCTSCCPAAVNAQNSAAQHSTAAVAGDELGVAADEFVEGGRRADSAAEWPTATPVEVETGPGCSSHTGDLCGS